jgi:hypothetical protein
MSTKVKGVPVKATTQLVMHPLVIYKDFESVLAVTSEIEIHF